MVTNSIPHPSLIDSEAEQTRQDLLRPVFHTSWRFYLALSILVPVGLAGIAAFLCRSLRAGCSGDRASSFLGFLYNQLRVFDQESAMRVR